MRALLITLLLLVPAACGRPPQAQNAATSSAPAPAPAPEPDLPPVGTAPDTSAGQASGNGPRERFIVCPGNPRCPPTSQPKGRQGN